MPKIVGFVTGLYVEDWIDAAIKQALHLCDEVIVAIGANTPELAVLEDRTMERAKQYGDQVKFSKSVMKRTIVAGKAPTLNAMLNVSSAKIGDWIWLLDADEYYFDDTAEKIRELIASDNDLATVRIGAKFFFINMTRYLHSSHNRLFKVTHKGVHFKPSQHWQGRGEKGRLGKDDARLGMFHYSLLMSPRYRKIFWETEYNQGGGKIREGNKNKLLWLEQIYNKFELDNEDYWIAQNEKLLGIKSPFHNKAFSPDKNGRLYRYAGPQPPTIEAAGLSRITDFREFKK
jgi:glycosyltransferase involved in cell wall biosynthesis